MTDNKPKITPSPHLMLKWREEARDEVRDVANHFDMQSIQMIKAANWGWRQRDANVPHELQKARDEELEACCEWLRSKDILEPAIEALRADRRPKTLKERGREALQSIHNAVVMETGGRELDVLKEIVESLPD